MEIILQEDIEKLGARGDVVAVAEGYARNYLLPRKLAVEELFPHSVIEVSKV